MRAVSTAAAPMAARCASVSRGLGASSMTFWWRRCSEHSRSPRWMTVPCASASTCTSMWRGLVTNRSMKRVSSPNDDAASRRAAVSDAASSPASSTRYMPLPPPPAAGLMSTGNPTRSAPAMRAASSRPGSAMPGTVATPRDSTACLAEILSPIVSIAEAGGPMNTTPASAHACANAAFSDRKP